MSRGNFKLQPPTGHSRALPPGSSRYIPPTAEQSLTPSCYLHTHLFLYLLISQQTACSGSAVMLSAATLMDRPQDFKKQTCWNIFGMMWLICERWPFSPYVGCFDVTLHYQLQSTEPCLMLCHGSIGRVGVYPFS